MDFALAFLLLHYRPIIHYHYVLQIQSRNTKYGIYKPNCGLDNLIMSWGHDEYLYRIFILKKEKLAEDQPVPVQIKPKRPFLKKGSGLIRYKLGPNVMKKTAMARKRENIKMGNRKIYGYLSKHPSAKLYKRSYSLNIRHALVVIPSKEAEKIIVEHQKQSQTFSKPPSMLKMGALGSLPTLSPYG
ncbi:hypothetical protein NQ317_006441 [Molorchus minor]|uniref:Inositol oxygenase n=1 Tax=Molorchus minor TaxID=1323400 RepID=A0ABQ9IW78_9CUCU|nr:hypothetical protein NQ317_006441 [Molorchus minor]